MLVVLEVHDNTIGRAFTAENWDSAVEIGVELTRRICEEQNYDSFVIENVTESLDNYGLFWVGEDDSHSVQIVGTDN